MVLTARFVFGCIASYCRHRWQEPSPTPRGATLTRQQVVILTSLAVGLFILIPNVFYIKQLCFALLLGRLAGLLFDLGQSLLTAWDRVPGELKRQISSSTESGRNRSSASGSLDLDGRLSALTNRLGEQTAMAKGVLVQAQKAACAATVVFLRKIIRLLQKALLHLDPHYGKLILSNPNPRIRFLRLTLWYQIQMSSSSYMSTSRLRDIQTANGTVFSSACRQCITMGLIRQPRKAPPSLFRSRDATGPPSHQLKLLSSLTIILPSVSSRGRCGSPKA